MWMVTALLISFLVRPALRLLEHHARQVAAHAALIAEILGLLAGMSPPGRVARQQCPANGEAYANPDACASRSARPRPASCATCRPACPCQRSPAIFYLSVNTVRRHMRHVYDKLCAYLRHEAVERARILGCSRRPRAGPEELPPRHAVS
jgi:LuxR family maltose regulon positive regulatory protein